MLTELIQMRDSQRLSDCRSVRQFPFNSTRMMTFQPLKSLMLFLVLQNVLINPEY